LIGGPILLDVVNHWLVKGTLKLGSNPEDVLAIGVPIVRGINWDCPFEIVV
jgi:hypothetical protein